MIPSFMHPHAARMRSLVLCTDASGEQFQSPLNSITRLQVAAIALHQLEITVRNHCYTVAEVQHRHTQVPSAFSIRAAVF